MKRIHGATISTLATALLVTLAPGAARAADTVVQIPLPGVLDARCVTTLTNNNIVVFTLTIDGGGGDVGTGGLQNGFATKAVAMMKSAGNVANSLPDDGHFPADTRHPEIVLNYSNAADPTSPQTHLVKPMVGATPPATFTFPVPPATYSKLFLFFHGADGGTTVKITLTYSDSTTDVTSATIPDFFSGPNDPKVFALVSNLAKWSKTTTIAEGGGHNIFGVELAPMAKTLSTVKVERGNTGYLVFWGATGVATSAVMGLPDAGTGTDSGAPADAAGAAGASGAGGAATGAAGTGGASGAAGMSGGAGASGGAGTSGGGGQTAGTTGSSGMSGTGTGGGAGSTTTTGTAGTGVTVPKGKSSSGCSYAVGEVGGGSSRATWLMLGVAAATCVARKRRRALRSRR